jgi:alpha-L-fucosidase 2
LTRSTYENLWSAHPPFQIDGNFGGAAGLANMMVQDRNGEIKILPAMPAQFGTGYVKGLRIKNGKTVDINWEDGELESYRIY